MMKEIKNQFLSFVQDKNLINYGDKIVVGLSGGPDSVCLLSLLNSIKEELNIQIVAAHINHMLRGIEADLDQEYARKKCNDLNIEFFSQKVDIGSYAKTHGLSTESAGRKVRYEYFNHIMNTKSFNKIATAHNANDQAETVLMHLMRGTGIDGLTGIPVIREDKYIRPILFMTRDQVEEYCRENGDKPRIDKTNLEREYSRNKVRLDLLPYMKEHFNKDIISAINRMADLLEQDNNYINKQAEGIFTRACYNKDEAVVIKSKYFECDRAIISRIIRKAIMNVNGDKFNIEMKHIDEVINLNMLGTNKSVNLPGNVYAENVYGDIHIKKKFEMTENLEEQKVIHRSEIENKLIEFGEYVLEFNVILNEQSINFSKNNLIKYFNYDNINIVIIRYRKDGDRMVPFGMSGSRKIKDILIDKKIPVDLRNKIPVIEFDDEIAWLAGVRESDKFRINSSTKTILKVVARRKTDE